MNTAVFILAGGSGIRLWPLSRKDKPKQFLPIGKNGLSFFRMTLSRALKITDTSHIFILTRNEYLDFVVSQAPQIPKENIFCESEKRNTAPAIATAMMRVKSVFGDMTSVILPADHYIADEDAFCETAKKAILTAKEKSFIVTIGIPPTRPDCSFGYIKTAEEISQGVYKTEGFKEKPDSEKALEFISDKSYFWNSGIFICKISFILEQFQKYLPEVFSLAERICSASDKAESDKIYSTMPCVSIDYGILEKTADILLVKGLFGWDDIGSWNALGRLYSKDENGNVLKGSCLAVDTKNCTVISDGSLTVAAGTEDLFIINTADAVLICSKNSTDKISELPSLIEDSGCKNLL